MNILKTLVLTSAIALGATGMLAVNANASVLHPGSDKFVDEGVVGPWTIWGDIERGSCLIEGQDAEGHVVQMGLTSNEKIGYVGLFSKSARVTEGAMPSIILEVNGHEYAGEAKTMDRDITPGYEGGYILTDDPQFIKDVQEGEAMTARVGESKGFIINLNGTAKAIEKAKECNAKMAGK